jgi:carbon-monoxide dehydrogenase large subunit
MPASGYIGARLARASALPLLQGRGCYVDDIQLPRMAHVAFVRSPFAHARIVRIRCEAARAQPGVMRVVTGAELAVRVKPYVGTLEHLPGMKAAPQHALALDRATWQGEPVAGVVAETRALAEDAAQLVEVEWEELPALTDPDAALAPDAMLIHPELGDNLVFEGRVDSGGVDEALAAADRTIDLEIVTDRHTAVALETRGVVAEFNRGSRQLTVHQSTQTPFMMQAVYARLLGIPEHHVRVIAHDVGGGFGGKIHVFGDELATVALAIELGRPLKFVADRIESFVSDVHARGHRIRLRMALAHDGEIRAIDVDDLFAVGPYSMYPRGSVNEARHVLNLTGGCYRNRTYRARSRAVLQNKNMYAQYRGVGHPIACLAGEVAIETAARSLGIDALELRRRNLIAADAYPYKLVSGVVYERLSQHACLDKLESMMDYAGLRAEQKRLRERGVYRGIGLATFVENSNHYTATYGRGGAPIASQDGCTMRVDGNGAITVGAGVAEMGQGTSAALAQIAASAVGVDLDQITMVIGDTQLVPYGAGNWGSRGTGIAGEATWAAGRALRDAILSAARVLLNCEASQLDIRAGVIVDVATAQERMRLETLARTVYLRPDHFPKEVQPELVVTRHYAQKMFEGGIFTNGTQAAYLEVDLETGQVRLLKHWVVDDCGVAVNPLLVDEQLRGGVVQGIGHALFESCIYSLEGQLANGSLIDYLVPMAAEMPDIEIGHVSTPTASSALGAKGAGEAGVTGAPAAILNAINDALAPLGATVTRIPATPERILQALRRTGAR